MHTVTSGRTALVRLLLVTLALVAGISTAIAQVTPTDTVPQESLPGDSVRRDTIPGDTIPGDTIPGDTIPGDTTRAEVLRVDPALPDTVLADTLPATVTPDTIPAAVPADTVSGSRRVGPEATDTLPDLPRDPVADSIAGLLRQHPDFVVTEYRGQSAYYTADDGVLRLRGNPEVARGSERLSATDSIVYQDRADLVVAYGTPTVRGEEQELTGDVLYYDLATRSATALGARTQVAEGSTWYVQGDVTAEDAGARLLASHARFTTCDLEIPHYHFESDRIMVIRDRILVARPARLYFGNVPVMVLPFVVQNLEQGRRSGLLIPRFSVNDIVRTSSNHTREISGLGWYWAINDYMGAQVTAGWRSGAYTSLQGDLDFNWRRQFLSGNFSFRNYWEDTGNTQFTLNGATSWRPDERTDLAARASYATSSRFVRDASFDPTAVTQELSSNLRVNRRFDWGTAAVGAERRQSIANDAVSGTFPSFSISPRTFTFLRAPTPELERWYSNATIQGNLSGERSFRSGQSSPMQVVPDEATWRLQGGIQQFAVGNLNFSAIGNLNRTTLQPITGPELPPAMGRDTAQGSWQANVSYQQRLIGQTMLSPTLGLRQDFRSSEVTGGYLGAPLRPQFGASLSTAVFGFFPGIGPYSAIRHRLSPSFSYTYSPQVQQTPLQREIFGAEGGRAQNVISMTLTQSFEAKLREPRTPLGAQEPPADSAEIDPMEGDTARAQREPMPSDAQRVTLLSINTSSIGYDFVRADSTGTGFITETISNTISSDYLRGLTINMTHDLFDRRHLDPRQNDGELGDFSPRLTSLTTRFELGPGSALFRWLGLGDGQDQPQSQNAVPDLVQDADPAPPGMGPATGNPMATGGGPWRSSLSYSFTRPRRTAGSAMDDRAIQTVRANSSFMLTPNWGVSWTTDYSITDREFGSHSLRFTRDLHRWQANFNFYQTPHGNSAFEFYVELIDNRDLKFEHREGNLRIDRDR